MKRCRRCKQDKPLSGYRSSPDATDGYETVCSSCRGKTSSASTLRARSVAEQRQSDRIAADKMRAADKMSTRKVLEPPRALIISSYAQALADVRKFRRYKIRAGETALTAHIRFNAERQARLEVLYAAARVRFNS